MDVAYRWMSACTRLQRALAPTLFVHVVDGSMCSGEGGGGDAAFCLSTLDTCYNIIDIIYIMMPPPSPFIGGFLVNPG